MLTFFSPLRKFFRIKVPSYLYIATVIVLCAIIFNSREGNQDNVMLTGNEGQQFEKAEMISQFRLNGYELIRPLLFTEDPEEDASLLTVKEQLKTVISNNIKKGDLVTASIFLKKLSDTRCVKLNTAEMYNPGSLMKVPVMIAYFKEAMNGTSAILNKKILFTGHNTNLPVEEGSVPHLTAGKSYTVSELINYMIIDSDNDAMALLVNNFDEKKLHKMFADLGVPVPPTNHDVFSLTPDMYARFLRILYNATYLDRNYSQQALSILTQTKYKKGLTRNIDASVKVAHKYGISVTDGLRSLSEAGIFYSDHPYLFVIMSKGSDYSKLSDIISECSDIVYKGVQ
jgi:beta-lactamase class A